MKHFILKRKKRGIGLRILVISDVPWSEDNSVGNTYNNIFNNMNNVEFANLYCKPGQPNSKIPTKYYQITEKKILRNLIKKTNSKKESLNEKNGDSVSNLNKKEQKVYDLLRTLRFPFFFIVRELIWKIGKWKTNDLDNFLQEFNPDIILSFCLDSVYYTKVIDYCRLKTRAKTVLFFADDVYSYKRMNPLYLLHQFYVRRSIKRIANYSQLIYGATFELCNEYSGILNRKLFPLYKICNDIPETKNTINLPLKVTYTGNLFYGRWKVLALLAEAIKEINKESTKIFLDIYTSGLYDRKMMEALNIKGSSCLRKAIPYDEVKTVLKESDMVVHVESFERKEIRKTRLSFSTKIVDCIQSGSCLLAIGPSEVASINMLKNLDIAEVITSNHKEAIKIILEKVLENNRTLIETSEKMKKYGLEYHSQEYLMTSLYNKLEELSKGD